MPNCYVQLLDTTNGDSENSLCISYNFTPIYSYNEGSIITVFDGRGTKIKCNVETGSVDDKVYSESRKYVARCLSDYISHKVVLIDSGCTTIEIHDMVTGECVDGTLVLADGLMDYDLDTSRQSGDISLHGNGIPSGTWLIPCANYVPEPDIAFGFMKAVLSGTVLTVSKEYVPLGIPAGTSETTLGAFVEPGSTYVYINIITVAQSDSIKVYRMKTPYRISTTPLA